MIPLQSLSVNVETAVSGYRFHDNQREKIQILLYVETLPSISNEPLRIQVSPCCL